jgi:hypothetical protein
MFELGARPHPARADEAARLRAIERRMAPHEAARLVREITSSSSASSPQAQPQA